MALKGVKNNTSRQYFVKCPDGGKVCLMPSGSNGVNMVEESVIDTMKDSDLFSYLLETGQMVLVDKIKDSHEAVKSAVLAGAGGTESKPEKSGIPKVSVNPPSA